MILFVGPLDAGSTSLQRYNAVKKLYTSSKSVNILKKTTKNIIKIETIRGVIYENKITAKIIEMLKAPGKISSKRKNRLSFLSFKSLAFPILK